MGVVEDQRSQILRVLSEVVRAGTGRARSGSRTTATRATRRSGWARRRPWSTSASRSATGARTSAFSPLALREAIGDGPVLLNGGGNFGDLYAGQQQLRERVLAECRSNPVVQLSQSIHFEDPTNLDRVRQLVARTAG